MSPDHGTLTSIWIKRARGGPMDAVEHAVLEAGSGIVGNANRGGKRQVTLIDEDTIARLRSELGEEFDPSVRRANLLVNGVQLENTRNRVLQVGRVRVRVLGETKPCRTMEESVPGLQEAMSPNWGGGAFGEVLDDGEISVGDEVRWV